MTPRIGITTKAGGPATAPGRLYAAALRAAGGAVAWLEPDSLNADPRQALARVDALVLSGGVDVDPRHYGEAEMAPAGVDVDPARDALELPLIRAALDADLPILGICRGIQMLNVAAGGSLHQDLALIGLDPGVHQQRKAGRGEWDTAHVIVIAAGSRLAALLGSGRPDVNSFHHQAVNQVASRFIVTARAPDGVIEALEDPARTFVLGVQWHPERMVEHHAPQRRLFAALVDAVYRRR